MNYADLANFVHINDVSLGERYVFDDYLTAQNKTYIDGLWTNDLERKYVWKFVYDNITPVRFSYTEKAADLSTPDIDSEKLLNLLQEEPLNT